MADTGPSRRCRYSHQSGYWSSQPARSSFVVEKRRLRRQRQNRTSDVDSSDLARCRTVTSEDAADYQHCQKVWAENRRRFFGRKDGGAAISRPDPAVLAARAKDESRMPQSIHPWLPEASRP